jgi:hypothetical protein
MRSQQSGPMMSAVFFGAAGVVVLVCERVGAISVRLGFAILTVLLLAYLWTQILQLRRVHADRWLLNPVVLCSLVTFFMNFGYSNALYFFPEDTLIALGLQLEVTPAMFKLMWLVLLGAIAMWLGYWSRLAAYLSNTRNRKNFSKILQTSNRLHPWGLPILLIVCLTSRLISIQLGVFGYSSNYDRLIEMGGVTQYLTLGSSLGKLALVVIGLQYYANQPSLKTKTLFFVTLGFELIFGLLSGFKSQVVMPFVIGGICQYLMTNSVPKKWLLWVVVGMFAAYQIIEPFRDAKNSDKYFQGVTIGEISEVMIDAFFKEQKQVDDNAKVSTALSFMARSSLAYAGSLGIGYADRVASLPPASPKFLENIFLAPLHAWVPRLIWTSKPVGNLGLWYSREVSGNYESLSAMAMSPFTYLYFAGGAVAVFMGFLFIGMTQRWFFFTLQPTVYLSGAVVFLAMLTPVVVISDGLNDLIIVLARELPLLLIVQRIIYRRRDVPVVHYQASLMTRTDGSRGIAPGAL